jgi:hypothetical protein
MAGPRRPQRPPERPEPRPARPVPRPSPRLRPGPDRPRTDRQMGRRDRSLARQGHTIRALGTGRRAGPLGLDLFPRHNPRLPPRPGGEGLRTGGDRRHPWQLPRLGHPRHRRPLRRAPAHRLADLLHLRRQRVPDRRARGLVRPGHACCGSARTSPLHLHAHARGPRHRAPLPSAPATHSSAPTNRRDYAIAPPAPTLLDWARKPQAAPPMPSARSATSSPTAASTHKGKGRTPP